jgi:hypothetical protein
LEREHVEMKVKAWECFRSQISKPQYEGYRGLLWYLAYMRGAFIETRYAAVFEVIRWVA